MPPKLVELELSDRQIRRLERKINRSIGTFQKPGPLKKAVQAGTKRSGSNFKKITPKKTGRLRKSIGRKAKYYKGKGLVLGMIGPRTDGKHEGYHGHLIELGFTHRFGKKIPGRYLYQKRFDTDKGLILRDTLTNLKKHVKKALRSK